MSDEHSGTVPQLRALRGHQIEVNLAHGRNFTGTLQAVALDVMGRPQYLELRGHNDRQLLVPWCNVLVVFPVEP